MTLQQLSCYSWKGGVGMEMILLHKVCGLQYNQQLS